MTPRLLFGNSPSGGAKFILLEIWYCHLISLYFIILVILTKFSMTTLINYPHSSVLRTARKLALDRNTRTIYVPVDENIYFNGLSYRVRVTRDGFRTSKNFYSRKKAVKFRNKLFKHSLQLV